MSQLISEVLSDLETAIIDRRANIEIGNLPTISGNALQLRQLFQNLLSNALKFTPPDREPLVRINTVLMTAPQIQALYTNAIGSYIQVAIEDNGIGFEQKYTDRIFNLFQRLHGRNEYTGTGIGLAICKKVVDNHKGFLTAHSQPGKGATFFVYLPHQEVG
jgi:hypothetical protein